ncbi:transcriptional regulator GcvA [uncultured Sphingomonas sp.]|uniref:transcriptional regulator GcvA n=1 Tax=unclassified Sphingomonas TaxID=196159 RepID=UPI0025F56EF0|nr:transcriptional regulator GcvA [uncultured Sphingomonas sp.]
MRRLPSLAAVRVFEAAARHQNFTAAAQELGMTQAAVSYQIKVLEERLATTLFRREKRRVALTDIGSRVAAQLIPAFDAIDAAFAMVRAEDAGVLSITTTNTFGSTWLARRIGGFQAAHPDLEVRIQTTNTMIDFATAEVDLAIRSGTGGWPGLTQERLMAVDFTPMCSPEFFERHGGPKVPADLLRLPLISPDDPWIEQWLRDAGVDFAAASLRPAIRYDSQSSEGQAAMAGHGIAMLTPKLWQGEIATGRLVQPFAQVSELGLSYWLVCQEHRRRVPKIARFREWLLAEIASGR